MRTPPDFTGQLPADFSWNESPDGATQLLYKQHLIAIISGQNNGWAAQVMPAFASLGDGLCMVTDRRRGQAWLARWLLPRHIGVLRIADPDAAAQLPKPQVRRIRPRTHEQQNRLAASLAGLQVKPSRT